MTQVILDPQTSNRLAQANNPVELIDASGNLIGQFIPAVIHPKKQPTISEEELLRREQLGGGRSLAEILADLEKRK